MKTRYAFLFMPIKMLGLLYYYFFFLAVLTPWLSSLPRGRAPTCPCLLSLSRTCSGWFGWSGCVNCRAHLHLVTRTSSGPTIPAWAEAGGEARLPYPVAISPQQGGMGLSKNGLEVLRQVLLVALLSPLLRRPLRMSSVPFI